MFASFTEALDRITMCLPSPDTSDRQNIRQRLVYESQARPLVANMPVILSSGVYNDRFNKRFKGADVSLFSIKIRSYRAFRSESTFDVRPLTLLYGPNQAGKSTLLRSLALLADSLEAGAGPLDLDSPSLRGATFKELGWLGRGELSMTPEFTLTGGGNEPAPRLRIQYADEKGLVVNRFDLFEGEKGDKFRVSLDADTERVGKVFSASYAGRYRGAEWRGVLKFDKLIPEGLPEQAQIIANKVRDCLAPLKKVQWLRANRLIDGGGNQRPARCCQSDGSDLAALLQGEAERSVLDPAEAWLAAQDGIATEISLQSGAANRPQFLIGSGGREQLPLNLAGEGVRSLLPILLTACWSESAYPNRPTMLAIEEPEAHLHPTLQVSLFDRLLSTVKAGIPVVLETHSVYILRAMQVAVLEGRLNAEDVGLHWVSQDKDGAAAVIPVQVEKDAVLTGWRPFVFEKEQELSHRIVDLRWQQGAKT